jgi:hypothetical protein
MKKTNSINKLAFYKATVTELNSSKMNDVNGGSSPFLPSSITIVFEITKQLTVPAGEDTGVTREN